MNRNNHSILIDIMRDQRVRYPKNTFETFSTTPSMEGCMFKTLMTKGAYRVDYVNKEYAGSQQALGLYVSGNILDNESYSRNAKHDLYQGLVLIRELLNIQHLVAIYLDINDSSNLAKPAYQQLKQDMRAGMFHRVLVLNPNHLFADGESLEDWWRFYREQSLCVILSPVGNTLQPVSLFDQCGANSFLDQEGSCFHLTL